MTLLCADKLFGKLVGEVDWHWEAETKAWKLSYQEGQVVDEQNDHPMRAYKLSYRRLKVTRVYDDPLQDVTRYIKPSVWSHCLVKTAVRVLFHRLLQSVFLALVIAMQHRQRSQRILA